MKHTNSKSIKTKNKRATTNKSKISNIHINKNQAIYTSLILLLLVISASAFYYRVQFLQEKNYEKSYPNKNWVLGEIAVDSRFAFSLLEVNVDEESARTYSQSPTPNYKFLMTKISFNNISDNVYHLSPIVTMQLKDNSSGASYSVTGAPNTKNPIGGPVKAMGSTIGDVGFTVPSSSNDFSFVFTPNLDGAQQIIIPFKL